MKRLGGVIIVLIVVAAPAFAVGQTTPPAAPTGRKTLAATMNVYVFPNNGQKPEQQSQDEAACYNYAAQNTETDPFALQKQAQQQAQKATAQRLDHFKKAFSVCLEAKNYMVKH